PLDRLPVPDSHLTHKSILNARKSQALICPFLAILVLPLGATLDDFIFSSTEVVR
ncbi:11492_t:CDS:2, partial [Dentiscutata heterogama]